MRLGFEAGVDARAEGDAGGAFDAGQRGGGNAVLLRYQLPREAVEDEGGAAAGGADAEPGLPLAELTLFPCGLVRGATKERETQQRISHARLLSKRWAAS